MLCVEYLKGVIPKSWRDANWPPRCERTFARSMLDCIFGCVDGGGGVAGDAVVTYEAFGKRSASVAVGTSVSCR